MCFAVIAIGTAPTVASGQGSIVVRVDPRVELFGVLYRLAGRGEYNMTQVPAWAEAVDEHFRPFRRHPAIQATRGTRAGFFIPMNLAVHVADPPSLEERTSFEGAPSLHERWSANPDRTREYMAAVRDFARDSGFEAFFAGQAALIDTTETRLRQLVSTIDQGWFEAFSGTPAEADFLLVAGLLNGRASYGVNFDRGAGFRKELYAVTGVTEVDEAGFPLFTAAFTGTIVHEFAHSYVDAVLQEAETDIAEFGDRLYEPLAPKMRALRYGSWESVVREAVVRAMVARYYRSIEGDEAAHREVEREVELGFTWMPQLYTLLGDFEDNRTTYRTLGDFRERLVEFFRAQLPSGP